MAKQAFALKEGEEDSFVDAAATVPGGEGRTLRIKELLEKGNGVVATDDPDEQEALSTIDALKQVSTKEADELRKAAKTNTKRGGDQR